MSEYSRELHSKLLECPSINTLISSPKVTSMHAHAISKEDFGLVVVSKNTEPAGVVIDAENDIITKGDSLITISEYQSIPENNDVKVIKHTNYISHTSGEFSEPNQHEIVKSENAMDNITVRDALLKYIVTNTRKIDKLQKKGVSPSEVMRLKSDTNKAYEEIMKHIEVDTYLNSLAHEYDEVEQQRIVRKIGSLIIVKLVAR